MDAVKKQIVAAHEIEYGVKPDVIVYAPGRFHLMGDHSWFCRDKTLSMAVDIPVYVAVSGRKDTSLCFYFHQMNDTKRSNLVALKFKKEDKWANALKAIVYGFVEGNFAVNGMDVSVYSDILPSAGFGITTAIKVCTALAANEVFDLHCSESDIMRVIRRGNMGFLNIGNYFADIVVAMYAEEGYLVLTDHAKVSWDYIPFDFPDHTVLLIDARVPRVSVWNEETLHGLENVLLLGELKEIKPNAYGGWAYTQNDTEVHEVLTVAGEEMRRRLLCIMAEHKCVLRAVEGLHSNKFGMFARAVNTSHKGMRDMYEISCPEIDWILKRVGQLEPCLEDVRSPVTCGRITGKGFGRCAYAIIRNEDIPKFQDIMKEYAKIFGFHPELYTVHTANGAHLVT